MKKAHQQVKEADKNSSDEIEVSSTKEKGSVETMKDAENAPLLQTVSNETAPLEVVTEKKEATVQVAPEPEKVSKKKKESSSDSSSSSFGDIIGLKNIKEQLAGVKQPSESKHPQNTDFSAFFDSKKEAVPKKEKKQKVHKEPKKSQPKLENGWTFQNW